MKAAGIAWFHSDTYEESKSRFSDGDKFLTTYAEWLERAEQAEKVILDQGVPVIRVYVDSDEFTEWVDENGIENVDSAARRDFANYVAGRDG